MDTITAAELADEAGVTPQRVGLWTQARLVRPVDLEQRPWTYEPTEARVARAVDALGRLGVPTPHLLAVADLVRSSAPGSDGEVVVHPDGLVRFDGPRDGACWVLPLAACDGVPATTALAG